MTHTEALKLALEALELAHPRFGIATEKHKQAITAIKEALAQPEYRAVKTYHEGKPVYVAQPQQEPVALEKQFSLLLWDYQELERAFEKVTGGKWIRKNNTPQRTWVDLTFAEICECENDYLHIFARAIEAKLKDKNK